MIFLLQVVKTVQPVVYAIQLSRVEVGAFQQSAHLVADVLQLDVAGVQPLCQFGGLRQHLADAAEGVQHAAHLTDGTSLLGGQRMVSLVEGGLDVLGVRHGLALLFQLFQLAFFQLGGSEFLVLKLQKVLLLAVALDAVLHGCQFALSLLVVGVGLLITL